MRAAALRPRRAPTSSSTNTHDQYGATMNPKLLRRAGTSLFGNNYSVPALARALRVSDRSIRRWLNSTAPMPEGVMDDLIGLVVARHKELLSLLVELKTCRTAMDMARRSELTSVSPSGDNARYD